MKHKFILLILIAIVCFSSLAADGKKSKALAAFMSLALPGSGEMYAKSTASGYASLTSEALLWFAYFGFLKRADYAQNDYIKYALAYSGTGLDHADDLYFDLLQDYFSSDEYNNHVFIYARNGLYYGDWTEDEYNQFLDDYLYDGDAAWDWGSTDVWYKYGELRRQKNTYRILSKFTIAGMIVNRVVSMIKAVRAVHLYNKGIEENDLTLNLGFDHLNQRFSLSLQKRF